MSYSTNLRHLFRPVEDGTLDSRAVNGYDSEEWEAFTYVESLSRRRYYDSTGELQTAAVNGERFDHDPETLAPKGLLVEDANTNIFLRSDEPNSWTEKTNVSVSGTTSAPETSKSAYLTTESDTGAGTSHYLRNNYTGSTTATTTCSVFLKANGRSTLQLRCVEDAATSNGVQLDIDLGAGTVSGGTAIGSGWTYQDSGIQSLINDWFRVWITFDAGSAAAQRFYLYGANPLGTITYDGDGSSGWYTWCVHIGFTAFLHMPVSTTTFAASALWDTIFQTNRDWWDNREGILYLEFDVPENIGTDEQQQVLYIYGGDNERYMLCYQEAAGNNSLSNNTRFDNDQQIQDHPTQLASGGRFRMAWYYSDDNSLSYMYVNGTKGTVISDWQAVSTLDTGTADFHLCSNNVNAGHLDQAWIREFRFYSPPDEDVEDFVDDLSQGNIDEEEDEEVAVTDGAFPRPPVDWRDQAEHHRKFVHAINLLMDGHTNAANSVTLGSETTTTVVTDERVGKDSIITFMPRTQNAAQIRSSMYVSDRGDGTFTLTHSSTAQSNMTFEYSIHGTGRLE